MRVLLVARDPSPVLPMLRETWPNVEWVNVPVNNGTFEPDLARIEVAYLWDYRSKLLQDLWPSLPDLRWVHVAAAGVDAFLFPELRGSDVVLTNSRGAFDESVAEFGLALILMFAKRLNETMINQQNQRWQHVETQLLSGRTVAVVGFGAIGHLVGRKCRALGMGVLGVRRSGQGHPDADEMFSMQDLPTVLTRADYVVLVLPQTDETRLVIGTRELQMMRPDAVLINIGRGSALDEMALASALETRIIRGAGLDVFQREPLVPDHPLWAQSNVVITPHMASDADDWRRRLVQVFSDNLSRYQSGEPVSNQINKLRGY
ncbi:MAG: D-2-hydroxyacid dehydrogenase [Chloroflexota bacterium]